MTTIKFKRLQPREYQATTKLGDIIIRQLHTDNKWHIWFPDGKHSYRSSYKLAKAWSEKYLSRLIEANWKPEPVKPVKQETLKQKLTRNCSYVCGVEPIGSINSGVNACILHLDINNKSYYLVGREIDVTDTLFHKNAAHIKVALMRGADFNVYTCQNNHEIFVLDNFKEAEKLYNKMNQKIKDDNLDSIKEIQEAKKLAAKGDLNAMFTLSDYGVM